MSDRLKGKVALVLGAAAREGWRVRIEGAGSWVPADAPADLALTTRNLARITRLEAADLLATVEAGVPWATLQGALAEAGVWVAADAPGGARSTGGVVAAGSAGPLRTGFGAVREHVLGLTLVTGEGHVVRAGGRVVKNVAGYDLTKLATGSFGGFGVLTAVHLRLRAGPRADPTLVSPGERDALSDAARAPLDAGPPASYLALSHAASDIVPAQSAEMVNRLNQRMHQQGILRSQAEVARFFDGLDLLEPGVVRVQEWRPGSETEARSRLNMWGGVARKR